MPRVRAFIFSMLYLTSHVALAQLSDEEKLGTPDAIEEAERAATTSQESPSTPHTIRYMCRLNELERRVEVKFPNAPELVPCSVKYYKDVEAPGSEQTLWSANNTLGYCEQKAGDMVERLRGMGWSCSAL